MSFDARLSSPAVARNAGPILDVLRTVLPDRGLVLEVASGGGEHALAFARAFPVLSFQPSDPDPAARASISAWAADAALTNLLEPLALDAARPDGWPAAAAEALIAVNLVHISPWAATEGLFAGAARILPAGAPVFLYGPYREAGVPFATSNAAFDQSLRDRDPRWGVRDLADVGAVAKRSGFALDRRIEMPANNLSLVFRRV